MADELYKVIPFLSDLNLSEVEYVLMEDDEYYNTYKTDVPNMQAKKLESIVKLKLIGNGSHRGVYAFSPSICVKLELTEDVYNNEREAELYTYIKTNKPQLAQYLCPILDRFKWFNIMANCDCNSMEITSDDRKEIINLFEEEGILLLDLDDKRQFGRLNNKTVAVDYADWQFKIDKLELEKKSKEINKLLAFDFEPSINKL